MSQTLGSFSSLNAMGHELEIGDTPSQEPNAVVQANKIILVLLSGAAIALWLLRFQVIQNKATANIESAITQANGAENLVWQSLA